MYVYIYYSFKTEKYKVMNIKKCPSLIYLFKTGHYEYIYSFKTEKLFNNKNGLLYSIFGCAMYVCNL